MNTTEHMIYPDYIPEACRNAIQPVNSWQSYLSANFTRQSSLILYSRPFIEPAVKQNFDQLFPRMARDFNLKDGCAIFFHYEHPHCTGSYSSSRNEKMGVTIQPLKLLREYKDSLDVPLRSCMDLVLDDVDMMMLRDPQQINFRLMGKNFYTYDDFIIHTDGPDRGMVGYNKPLTQEEVNSKLISFEPCDVWSQVGVRNQIALAQRHKAVRSSRERGLLTVDFN